MRARDVYLIVWRVRSPRGPLLPFSLVLLVATACVPSSRDGGGSGSPAAMGPDEFQQMVESACSPDGGAVPCFFDGDAAACRRALEAQWPACAPDAALPDTSAARWALGEQVGYCAMRGAIRSLSARLSDPACKDRIPKQRIENPFLDASGGMAPCGGTAP